jgi:glucans biosynthesis protein
MGTECETPPGGRCGARLRDGEQCRKHPVRRRRRCRLHGGAKGSGAPRGNRNAVTHGRTTAAALAERRAIARLIRVSLRTLAEIGG